MTNEQADRIISLLESIDRKLSGITKTSYTMGAKDAAKYVGICYSLFLKLGSNMPPHTHSGKKLIFRSDTLDLWVKNREIKPVTEPDTIDERRGKIRRLKA